MKKNLLLCWACTFILLHANSQSIQISICSNKTTSLVFPTSILHVDRGIKEVLVQKIVDMDHMLLIKAASMITKPTNLTVITKDGSLFSILICFKENPDTLTYYIHQEGRNATTEKERILLNLPAQHLHIKKSTENLSLKLTGLYQQADHLLLQLTMQNESSSDFKLGLVSALIVTMKKKKRVADQQRPLDILSQSQSFESLSSLEMGRITLIVPQVHLQKGQRLVLRCLEKNSGRDVELSIKPKQLLKMTPFYQ